MTAQHTATEGWVLYDDSCGFCSRWVPFWGSTLQKRGFGIAPLQAGWVQARLALDQGELLQDLRLLLRDDRQIVGADVYRYVMRRVWWAYPAYLLSVAPLLRSIFDWSYRMFATYRYRVSAACGLRSGNARSSAPDNNELHGQIQSSRPEIST
jgi:predicted DCC family thiol-disulfide oxidoreductase YuxK